MAQTVEDSFGDTEFDFEKHGPLDAAAKKKAQQAAAAAVRQQFNTLMRSGEEVCKYWLRGLCRMEEECEYIHEYDHSKVPECFYYLRFGECHNPECVFRHVSLEERVPECAAYARGFCRYGAECRLRHVRKEPCPNYMAGLCVDGHRCRYGHPRLRYYTREAIGERLSQGELDEPRVPHLAVALSKGIPRAVSEIQAQISEPPPPGSSTDPLADELAERKQRYMQFREHGIGADGEERARPKCFRCGEDGHVSRECPLAVGTVPPMPPDGRQENFTTEEINRLCEERALARRARDFEEADRIRDRLRRSGVTLNDETRTWRHIDGRDGEQKEPPRPRRRPGGGFYQDRQDRDYRDRDRDRDYRDRDRDRDRGGGLGERRPYGGPGGKGGHHGGPQPGVQQLGGLNLPGGATLDALRQALGALPGGSGPRGGQPF